jgi:hypothetical protein
MLYREIIAVCSEIHTKHINTLCGQDVELLNVKPGGTYSNHWASEGSERYVNYADGHLIKSGLTVSDHRVSGIEYENYRRKQQVPPKRLYLSITLQGNGSQKNKIFILLSLRRKK